MNEGEHINKIGEIIEVKPLLTPHNNEAGCGTVAKVCSYLNCNLGETYVCFDDKESANSGVICKIKKDFWLSGTLAPFKDNEYDKMMNFGPNVGGDGNAIVYMANYKYIMRIL